MDTLTDFVKLLELQQKTLVVMKIHIQISVLLPYKINTEKRT